MREWSYFIGKVLGKVRNVFLPSCPLVREWSYFIGKVLGKVRDVFLSSCPQLFSLLKRRV